MQTTTAVESARRALGPVGVLLPVTGTTPPVAEQRDAVRRLETAGYRAAWTNEVVGGDKDAFVQLAVLLAATQRMVFGTSIANIWARPSQTAHGAATLLSQGFPGRFVLGLGVGYPAQAVSVGRQFGNPIATMRDYLGQLTRSSAAPASGATYPTVIGATGPQILALAGDSADGALPIMVPPAFTARARELLGPGKLLVVGVPFVADTDPGRARATAPTVDGNASDGPFTRRKPADLASDSGATGLRRPGGRARPRVKTSTLAEVHRGDRYAPAVRPSQIPEAGASVPSEKRRAGAPARRPPTAPFGLVGLARGARGSDDRGEFVEHVRDEDRERAGFAVADPLREGETEHGGADLGGQGGGELTDAAGL